MKTEPRGDGPSRSSLHISRSGRVVKRVSRFTEIQAAEVKPVNCGRWSTRDKENLLACLNKYPSVQYSPLTIWRSIRSRPKSQVLEMMLRLRKKAAAHSEQLRKKQPPILTWFQVADELSWLKDDEDLYMTIAPLLSIMTVEANGKQNKDTAQLVQFSKLYKYLKLLHKDDVLPELTPAESVVLLDCFQHLADTLRASDTKAQTKFMMVQYKKFFDLLYFEQEGVAETRVKDSSSSTHPKKKKKGGGKPKRSTESGSAQKPLMRAELRRREPRKRGKKKEAASTSRDVEGEGSQKGPMLDRSGVSQNTPDVGQRSEPTSQTHAGSTVGMGGDVGGQSLLIIDESSRTLPEVSSQGDGEDPVHSGLDHEEPAAGRGDAEAAATPRRDYGDLDPEDPQFLSKFAGMFNLGSLNPFEIPQELIDIQPKSATNDDSYSDSDDDPLSSLKPAADMWISSPVAAVGDSVERVSPRDGVSTSQENQLSARQHVSNNVTDTGSVVNAEERGTSAAVGDVQRITTATDSSVTLPINNNNVQGKDGRLVSVVELSAGEQEQDL